MSNRFNSLMDAWLLHPLWGLPLRMVFLCRWHRIHFAVIATGFAVAGAGLLFRQQWLWRLGGWIVAPSMICLALLPILALVFLALEKLRMTSAQPSR